MKLMINRNKNPVRIFLTGFYIIYSVGDSSAANLSSILVILE